MANYFANSAIGPNISTIDANGPFWPTLLSSNLKPLFFWLRLEGPTYVLGVA